MTAGAAEATWRLGKRRAWASNDSMQRTALRASTDAAHEEYWTAAARRIEPTSSIRQL